LEARLEADQAMSATCRFHTSHGSSVMRIYASYGAMNLGKTYDFEVARFAPSQFYTFKMMATHEMASSLSIKQFVAMVLFPMLLSCKCIENAIIGGRSLDSVFAFHAALELEGSVSDPRAVFAFASRGLPLVGVCVASRNLRSISRASRVSLRARALVNFCSVEVARFTFPDPTHRFTCPLMQHENALQDDCAIESRRQFYAVADCVDSLPNSIHMTIGSDHYWDIARRMRKDLSQRAAIV